MPSPTHTYVVELKAQLPSASVGAKAANLARVTEMGLPTPAAAAITRGVVMLLGEKSRRGDL